MAHLRPERPERPKRPARPGLRPDRLDLRPERPNFRLERPDLRPKRPGLRPKRPDEGVMNESPPVLRDFVPFKTAAQKGSCICMLRHVSKHLFVPFELRQS